MVTKQHILREICRTAEGRPDGTKEPLGKRRFFKETGIKESDWSGRYWARWSDALRDAGFEPNKLRAAYEESYLIEKVIALTRELGRIPGSREIRLRRRNDPAIPDDTHLFKRFGSKSGLTARVLEYCRSHPEFADVIPLCQTVTQDSSPDEEQAPGVFGFVYLFKSGRYYKIGRSNAVGRREYEVALQLPEKLRKIHEITTDDPEGIEAYWQRRSGPSGRAGSGSISMQRT